MSELKKRLLQWDGQSTEFLQQIYIEFEKQADLDKLLLKSLKSPDLQIATSWLLKTYLSNKRELSEKQTSHLYKIASQFKAWQSQLHFLQSIHFLLISPKDKLSVEFFLRRCLVSDNKFVRAWSYHGFDVLAEQYPEYRTEVEQFFEMALKDEAASVKARIRNLIKTRKG
ncbi:hypothetical protein [Aliikangiella sp. IMCC44359]|uniref:hypothetical protein n=1 Tax=Aliikangiella sp. IMCC44359 TaxID=3459125 RepID=UPI00403A7D9F